MGVKHCNTCGRDLPEDSFPWYWDKTRGKHFQRGKCRECIRAYNRERYQEARGELDTSRCVDYSCEELRYRPLEQIMECISARDMAAALGWNKDTAARVKRDPSAFVDTNLELDDARVQQIREWLERQACTL